MSETLFPVDAKGQHTFEVELDVFSGPFSVLLSLISKKKLDVTTVALAAVTDEFIAYVRAIRSIDLSVMSEFLVVAATLLDLKIHRLLPHEDADEEDYELLEQRDLLFAKLLQYRAFKEVAADFGARLQEQARSFPRRVPLEDQYAQALPEIRLSIGAEELAMLAVQAFTRSPDQDVAVTHMHDPLVPVASQVAYVREQLTAFESVTFAALCAGAPNMATVVSRFLAILEMIRNREIYVEQAEPLGSITISVDRGGNGQ